MQLLSRTEWDSSMEAVVCSRVGKMPRSLDGSSGDEVSGIFMVLPALSLPEFLTNSTIGLAVVSHAFFRFSSPAQL